MLQLTAFVELFEDGREIVNVKLDVLLRGYLRDSLQGKLIVGIEGKLLYLDFLALLLDAVDLAFYPHEIFLLDEFRHQTHQLMVGRNLLSVRSGTVIGQGVQFLNLAPYVGVMLLLFLGERYLLLGMFLRTSFQFLDTVVFGIFLFQFLLITSEFPVLLVFQ